MSILRQPLPNSIMPEDVVKELAWAIYSQSDNRASEELASEFYDVARSFVPSKFPAEGEVAYFLQWIRDAQPFLWLLDGDPSRKPGDRISDEVLTKLIRFLGENDRDSAIRTLVETGLEIYYARRWASLRRLMDEKALHNGQWLTREHLEELQRAVEKGAQSAEAILIEGILVPRRVANEVFQIAVHEGKKIQAIKLFRSELAVGLKDAKIAVETIMENPEFLKHYGGGNLYKPPPPQNKTARERLDRCIRELLIKRPFYWLLLSELLIHEDPSIKTMAVGLTENQRMILFYNPEFVMEIYAIQCQGVLIHELNHLLFGHVTHPHPERLQNPIAWTLACECSANEFVPFPLPGQPITCEYMGIPLGQSTYDRFELLKKRDDLDQFKHLLNTKFHVPPLMYPLKKDPKHHRERAGHYPPDYPVGTLVEAAKLSASEGHDEDAAKLAEALKNQGISELERLSVQLAPEEISHLPWPQLIRQTLQQKRVYRTSRRYPNRRFPKQLGVIPGRRAERKKIHVLAAIDTSASMSYDELQDAVTELLALMKQEVRVLCVQCDTQICDVRWLSPHERVTELHGRGGTDLRPPFDRGMLEKHEIRVVIYFTDGYGPAPEHPPEGVEVLWVLTGYGPTIPAKYGDVTCLKPREQRQRVQPHNSK